MFKCSGWILILLWAQDTFSVILPFSATVVEAIVQASLMLFSEEKLMAL